MRAATAALPANIATSVRFENNHPSAMRGAWYRAAPIMGAFELVVSEGPNKGQSFAFPSEATFVIGSAAECQVRLDASLVQPRHAEISVEGDAVAVRDLTHNGLVWINGESRVDSPLLPGTFLRLGRVEMVLRHAGRSSSPSGTMATPTPIKSNVPPRTASRISGANVKAAPAPGVPFDATAKRPTPFASAAMHAELAAAPKAKTPHGNALGAPTDSLTELAPGVTIDGRYLVVSKLAAGGMGEVYKAEHIELGKLFAIKVMLPELSRDAEFVARFKREAISASRIGQQNIVDISDFGQTNQGRFYFVMEFLDGLTLASVTHREGAVRVDRVLNIAVQVTRALAAAHAQGIVHRDLKPENIMLLQRPGQPDFVKVLDFGVAKVAAGHGQGGHTAVGMVVGTPQYMSPEQAKAIPVDARSDIYSLGLIFYELLTGRPTFTAETPSMLMVKHVTERPPPFEPGPLGEVPVELEELIFKMLQKEPGERPQTMEEVVSTLDLVWSRFKANDPTLRRISGEYPNAGPLRSNSTPRPNSRKQLATNSQAKNATPAKPSGSKVRRNSGVVAAPSPEDSAEIHRRAENDSESSGVTDNDELAVKSSKLPLVIVGMLVLVGLGGGAYVFRGGLAAPTEATKVEPGGEPIAVPVAVKTGEPTHVPEATRPPVAAAPEKVTITFETSPEGAEVFEASEKGDVLVGSTKPSFTLTRETDARATLKFVKPGYDTKTQIFGFVATQKMQIELHKEVKVAPKHNKPKPDDDLKGFE